MIAQSGAPLPLDAYVPHQTEAAWPRNLPQRISTGDGTVGDLVPGFSEPRKVLDHKWAKSARFTTASLRGSFDARVAGSG